MPELPEVETIVRDLRPVLIGRVFLKIDAEFSKAVLPHPDHFEKINGLKVEKVERRGKYINIFLEKDFVITVHLRMSGRLIADKRDKPALRFERTRLDFEEISLRFCDMRRFGRVWLNRTRNYEAETGIARLGVEPLSDEFDVGVFKEKAKGRKGNLKAFLLRQDIIAGIGNIYADEACFYAKVKPGKEVSELSNTDMENLHAAIVRALEQGIRNRGTSISDYADAFGKNGKNQEVLYVYSRGGKPCLICGQTLIKTRLAGRGTVYCPGCQK